MKLSDQLRDQLTPILEVADLKDARSQYEGPCPLCKAGTDRFFVKKSSPDRYYCRQCNGDGQGGSVIDFHMRLGSHATMLDLARAMGITREKKVKVQKARVSKKNLIATYKYKDENGNILFYVGRHEEPGREKTFRQWRIEDGKRINKVKGVRLVPYQLPLLMDSDLVFIVEGEKDVARLIREGLCATCFMGANWLDEYTQYFEEKKVYILPDNDGPGEILGRKIGKATGGKIVTLPNLPDKGDVSDWLRAGHTIDELWQAVDTAESVKEEDDWPDPEPIPGATFKTAGQDYPYECLPDVVKKAAAEVARFSKVPEVSPGVVGVATVATSIGKKAIIIERKGLTHFASIFFALLAPSGERKTPPFKYMTKPLEDWIEELMEGYKELKAEVKAGNKVLDSAMGLITANAKKPGADLDALKKSMTALEGQRQAPPVYPSIFTTNTTEERLFQKMYDRGGAFAVMSGEGRKVFDIIMGQYTGGGQTGDSIYLAGLSGDTITRDRVGGDQGPEESLIRNPCLTACVMVQPDKYMEAARVKPLRESGALARIWPVNLPSLVGSRIEEAGEDGLNETALEPYNNMVRKLLEAERDEPLRVYLSEDATEARRICHNEFELLMAEGQIFNDVSDIVSKAVSQIAKVAMILHIADNPGVMNQDSTMLDLRCWERAEAIGRYHLAESINVQRSAGDSDVHRVAEWIKDKKEVTARMVMQFGPRPRIVKATKAIEVLETLVDLHHLRANGEKSKRFYVVNPKCSHCSQGKGPK